MPDWRWIDRSFVIAAHSEQIKAHGGGQGMRDEGLLESALARAQNLDGHGEPDVADLAAAYAFGVARNHPFVDGNKRTALVIADTFLIDNGFILLANDAELVVLFQHLAAGEVSEIELADWFRTRIVTA